MRIALWNWARVWDGAAVGGGINGYGQALALALIARGHEVHWLCSGTRFDRDARGRVGAPRVDAHPDWLGVRVREVVNSPVLAPSLPQFNDPTGETRALALERLVERWAAEVRPDVVHVQSLEGFSAGCIAAARRAWPATRIVFSLHNYHTICPQVYLLQGHRRACTDYRGGEACAGCVPSVDPARERERLAGPATDLASRVRLALRVLRGPAADDAAAHGKPAGAPQPRFAGESRGSAPELVQLARPHPWSADGLAMPARRPIANDPAAGPGDRETRNDYGRRRAAMIDALNACDAVLAVSRFVAEKFVNLGVRPELVRVVPIGSTMPEIVARRPEALRPPPPPEEIAAGRRPLRLAFMGFNSWYKGLPMLIEALDLLVPELQARIHLSVFARGGEASEGELARIEPRLAGVSMRHGYRPHELPWLLSGVDLGVVPSVWWDNGPQTVMEFLACGVPVLGAALGGIPDRVRDGENGVLFTGNDRVDLARALAMLLRDPATLRRLRSGVRPPGGMEGHAEELEDVYSGRPRGTRPDGARHDDQALEPGGGRGGPRP